MRPAGRYRLLRSHDCVCSFRNEFDVAIIEAGAAEPAVDMDELELCPRAGCGRLVPVGALVRIAVRTG